MRISDWSSDVCSSDLLLNACLSLDPALLDSEQGESAYNAYTSKEFPPVLLARLRSRIRTSYMNATSEPVYSRFDGGWLAIGKDRKTVVSGMSVSVRVDTGGGRYVQKKTKKKKR